MSNHPPPSAGAGPSGGMTIPAQQQQQQQQNSGALPQNAVAQQNLNQIVLEYLSKKGYVNTEATLRQESAYTDKDGRPIIEKAEEVAATNHKYKEAFDLVNGWIETNLDIYKLELSRLLWPLFVYSYLEMINEQHFDIAKDYFKSYKTQFERAHKDELSTIQTIASPVHAAENPITKLYQANKYRLPLNSSAYYNLITFLESNGNKGGNLVLRILTTCCQVVETKRGPIDPFSFEAIIAKAREINNDADDAQEGIAGGFTGASNQNTYDNSTPLKLGVQPMEADLAGDVRAELEEEDVKNPPEAGQLSLVETFDQRIKLEENADALGKHDVPYPGSKARDVWMEVTKIKEYRDRFKIEGRTGGVGPAVSTCMFTFHNTLDSVTCIEFSDDNQLVAVGTEESYIRVWTLDGSPLSSAMAKGPKDPAPTSSRRLTGHSGAVYNVAFSPSSTSPTSDPAATAPRLLLSCSADGTIRLWSLEAWICLIIYKGHHGPVWNVRWGPFGHYFVSCGRDMTVRVWTQDHIAAVRMMVGHDSSVNQIAYHPNGAYVFSAADQADKSVRMWSVTTGQCVRVFLGHTEFISALECSPDGKTLASADGSGSIILWDLTRGTQIKRMKGHGRGGVWSLTFSVESNIIASGGADGTVRIWDVQVPTDPYKNGDGETVATGGQADATRINVNASTPGAGGGAGVGSNAGSGDGTKKKKGKEQIITSDQISAFPTKKSPVYKVKFTRMNLIVAGGCFLP